MWNKGYHHNIRTGQNKYHPQCFKRGWHNLWKDAGIDRKWCFARKLCGRNSTGCSRTEKRGTDWGNGQILCPAQTILSRLSCLGNLQASAQKNKKSKAFYSRNLSVGTRCQNVVNS